MNLAYTRDLRRLAAKLAPFLADDHSAYATASALSTEVAARTAGDAFHGLQVQRNSALTVHGGDAPAIAWTGEKFDTDGYHASNSTDIIIPTGLGDYYVVTAMCQAEGTNQASKPLLFFLRDTDNVNQLNCYGLSNSGGLPIGFAFSGVVNLVDGDVVTVSFQNNQDSGHDAILAAGITALSMVKVR